MHREHSKHIQARLSGVKGRLQAHCFRLHCKLCPTIQASRPLLDLMLYRTMISSATADLLQEPAPSVRIDAIISRVDICHHPCPHEVVGRTLLLPLLVDFRHFSFFRIAVPPDCLHELATREDLIEFAIFCGAASHDYDIAPDV